MPYRVKVQWVYGSNTQANQCVTRLNNEMANWPNVTVVDGPRRSSTQVFFEAVCPDDEVDDFRIAIAAAWAAAGGTRSSGKASAVLIGDE